MEFDFEIGLQPVRAKVREQQQPLELANADYWVGVLFCASFVPWLCPSDFYATLK